MGYLNSKPIKGKQPRVSQSDKQNKRHMQTSYTFVLVNFQAFSAIKEWTTILLIGSLSSPNNSLISLFWNSLTLYPLSLKDALHHNSINPSPAQQEKISLIRRWIIQFLWLIFYFVFPTRKEWTAVYVSYETGLNWKVFSPEFLSFVVPLRVSVCLLSRDISVVQTLAPIVKPAPRRKMNGSCWIVTERGLGLLHLNNENTKRSV